MRYSLLLLIAAAAACSRSKPTGAAPPVHAALSVTHFDDDFLPNPSPPGMEYNEFVSIYRDMKATCERFGPATGGGSERVEGAKFYVLWDEKGLDHRYAYVEVLDPAVFTAEWVEAVAEVCSRHKGWGVGIDNLKDGYVLVFADRVMVKGLPFADCRTVTDVATAGRGQLFR
jgi:hypothetical protein